MDDDAAQVTIVVVPRDHFGVSARSLASIIEHTPPPYELVYVDGNSPRSVRDHLAAQAAEHGFRLVRTERYLAPNEARNLGFAHVDTPFTVFVDNDVVVTENWLGPLVDCAETTGAWAVSPLILEGEPAEGIIHITSGDYWFEDGDAGRTLHTAHRHQKTRLDELDEPLERTETAFVEVHCVLVRTDELRRLGAFDEGLRGTRDHLDLCLTIHQAGGTVWSEPSSVVAFDHPPRLRLSDLRFYLLRWSEEWTVSSLEHFVATWDLDPAYLERAEIAAWRRREVVRPLGDATKRVLGEDRVATIFGVARRGERVANRAVTGLGRRLAEAKPTPR